MLPIYFINKKHDLKLKAHKSQNNLTYETHITAADLRMNLLSNYHEQLKLCQGMDLLGNYNGRLHPKIP